MVLLLALWIPEQNPPSRILCFRQWAFSLVLNCGATRLFQSYSKKDDFKLFLNGFSLPVFQMSMETLVEISGLTHFCPEMNALSFPILIKLFWKKNHFSAKTFKLPYSFYRLKSWTDILLHYCIMAWITLRFLNSLCIYILTLRREICHIVYVWKWINMVIKVSNSINLRLRLIFNLEAQKCYSRTQKM